MCLGFGESRIPRRCSLRALGTRGRHLYGEWVFIVMNENRMGIGLFRAEILAMGCSDQRFGGNTSGIKHCLSFQGDHCRWCSTVIFLLNVDLVCRLKASPGWTFATVGQSAIRAFEDERSCLIVDISTNKLEPGGSQSNIYIPTRVLFTIQGYMQQGVLIPGTEDIHPGRYPASMIPDTKHTYLRGRNKF